MDTYRDPRPPDFESFADALGTFRHVIDHLLFKVTTLRLLVDSGEGRFVAGAADELEQAIRGVAAADPVRCRERDRLATQLGMVRDELSVWAASHRAPPPFNLVYEDHARTLAQLVAETQHVADECAGSLTRRMGQLMQRPVATSGAPADPLERQVEYLACQEARRMVDRVLPKQLLKHLL